MIKKKNKFDDKVCKIMFLYVVRGCAKSGIGAYFFLSLFSVVSILLLV